MARILLGLACRSLSGAAEGGHVALRAATENGETVVTIDLSDRGDPSLAWMLAVAEESVRDMGGSCSRTERGSGERLELRFEKENES
jgi:hypothetical protein